MKYSYNVNSPIGVLCLEEENGFLVGVRLDYNAYPSTHSPSPLLQEATIQLKEYFEKKRTSFDLPLLPKGTAFQEKVWAALREIPYGQTLSYGELAKLIGQPKASRAVGGANNKNPILIMLPCHRVIGANGKLVGFGCGIEVKNYLLDLEKSTL